MRNGVRTPSTKTMFLPVAFALAPVNTQIKISNEKNNNNWFQQDGIFFYSISVLEILKYSMSLSKTPGQLLQRLWLSQCRLSCPSLLNQVF